MADPTAQADFLRLLDPAALTQLGRLELVARGVVEGFVSGRHRSPYKGFSAEFAEHRQYARGDDPRTLDWKVYGRSDRYYIRQFEEETNLRCLVLLDASGSMAYAGTAADAGAGPLSKLQYGQFLAAALAQLMVRQQDAVGLATFDTRVRRYIPPRGRTSHLRGLLEELVATAPGGETALGPILHDLAERVLRRGLVVIISDFLDEPGTLLEGLHHFRYRRHELLLLHVLAREELSFPFTRFSRFDDLEHPGQHLSVDPAALRAAYLDRLAAHLDRLREGAGQLCADYVQLCTDEPFGPALARYLAGRGRIGRA